MKHLVISTSLLVAKNACDDQLRIFKHLYPEGASFSSLEEFKAACEEHAQTFDFRWATEQLLDATCAAYERQIAQVFAELYWRQEMGE